MGLEEPRAVRSRGVGEVELSAEREAWRSRLIKETYDVSTGRVGGHARDILEPPMVVGGAVPEVSAFREGVGCEDRS